jgi:hypothetical protein
LFLKPVIKNVVPASNKKKAVMKTILYLSALMIFAMPCSFSQIQKSAVPGGGMDLFSSDELLQITLCFDIREFVKTKNEQQYMDAQLTVKTSEDDSVSQDIKLKARGFMRLSYCSFPPIMLKFSNKKDSARIMGKGTLKLVTHCTKSAVFEDYLFKEYLAYKLFNLVTPYSFKTRLVQIHYVDINKPENSFTAYGFLVENEETMAARNNAVVINLKNVTQKQMETYDMARVAVFNFMIGNTDWSVPFQHNVKIVKTLNELSDKGIPVAYDFDFSGLVNTVYSAPAEQLPIKSVSERYYLGMCYSDEELKPVIDEFIGLKEQFLGIVEDFNYLSKGDKKQVENYINSFYKMNKNQTMLISDLNRTCKSL